MADPFRETATWESTGEATFGASLSERWANGPGAYGGIVAASFLRQMSRVLDDDDQQPRTLNVHMAAPVRFEEAEMQVELQRRGVTVSHLTATIDQSGDRTAFASATFAGSRADSPSFDQLEPPEADAPDDLEVVSDTPLLPRFAQEFFEYRYCLGAFPMSGADRPESGGWLGPEDPAADGPVLAACLLDAWPPSVFATFETFRRTVTVDLRYQFWDAPEASEPSDEPHLFFAESNRVDDGYAEEDAVLWARDGDLVARAKQLYAILD